MSEAEVRLPRRRRSAATTPVLIDPADIPEDAAGRVEVIAVRAPADVIEPGERPDPQPPQPSQLLQLVMARGGWVAIAVLGAVIVVVFVLGMTLTR